MIDYPPPADNNSSEITHVTKNIIKFDKGPVQSASINYMHRDGSRTSFVATLDDVRQWAAQTSYPFLAWVLSVIGFAEVLIGFLIERYKARQGNEG